MCMNAYAASELRRDYARALYKLVLIEDRIRDGKAVYGDEDRARELWDQVHRYENQMDAQGMKHFPQ